MKTQVELLKECCDIKDAACVKYQKRITELEEENKELKEWKENLVRADKKKSDHIDELEEENKKLKEENEKLRSTLEGISFVI